MSKRRKYKLRHFLFDVVMICCTFGFWFIWIYCREMRNR